ncbi:hypothetical protein M446_1497 [Methylobacterium sp. 4-46]|uniref:hypothetical protein n=1 Tax=unclassified Methylobacterium TaxID=2615210 RepID=UPI000152CE35|nr:MULTISPECIES: hypothetical protein [Methylobacterium]ACA16002.1 hypothetical protein M446_1497 [Methylobacterium sp. 4-46]WFT81716.1 hypothetical protein QA634_07590 [Methylobacterium nodulans]
MTTTPAIAPDSIPHHDPDAANAWLQQALASLRPAKSAAASPPSADAPDDTDAAFNTLAVYAAYLARMDPTCVRYDLMSALAEHEPYAGGPLGSGVATKLADALASLLPSDESTEAPDEQGAAEARYAAALQAALAAFLACDRDLNAIPLTAACRDLADAVRSGQPGAAYEAVQAIQDLVSRVTRTIDAATSDVSKEPSSLSGSEGTTDASPAALREAMIARLEARLAQLAPNAPDSVTVAGWIQTRLAHLRWAARCELPHSNITQPA